MTDEEREVSIELTYALGWTIMPRTVDDESCDNLRDIQTGVMYEFHAGHNLPYIIDLSDVATGAVLLEYLRKNAGCISLGWSTVGGVELRHGIVCTFSNTLTTAVAHAILYIHTWGDQ